MDQITHQTKMARDVVSRFGGEACVYRSLKSDGTYFAGFDLKPGRLVGQKFRDVDGDECEVMAVVYAR